MAKKMTPKAEQTKQVDPPKKPRKNFAGQQRFNSIRDYLNHVEENLGRLHLDSIAKGRLK